MGKYISDVNALAILKDAYVDLGRIPTGKDFKNNSYGASHVIFARKFGTYENACLKAGLIDKIYTKSERIKISIDCLKNEAYKLKRCPTVKEYNLIINDNKLCRKMLERYLKITYNDFCIKYIPQYTLNLKYSYTKDELVNIFNDFIDTNNFIPSKKCLSEHNLPSTTALYSTFNMTYNQFLEHLGYSGKQKPRPKRTNEELLSLYKDAYNKKNGILSRREFGDYNIPATDTYRSRFGTMMNVYKILELDIIMYDTGKGMGKICIDKNGELCNSNEERIITNFLIDNGVEFEKEVLYKNIININNNYSFDWVICQNDTTYYVEYFGMYNELSNYRPIQEYVERTKEKIKLLKTHGLQRDCIFIYPKDIKSKSLTEIFKEIL